MRYVTVEVEVDAAEVIEGMDDQELQGILERCGRADAVLVDGPLSGLSSQALLERSYYAMRGRVDMPAELREYFWRTLGRIA